jgi:hypothetical protein
MTSITHTTNPVGFQGKNAVNDINHIPEQKLADKKLRLY